MTTKLTIAAATAMHTCITPGCPNDARPGHDICDTCWARPEPRRRRRAAVTMLAVCSAIQPLDESGNATQRTRGQAVTDGLQPKPAPTKPGLHLLTPAQLAGLTIAQADVETDGVTGYQREIKISHARAIARRLAEDHPFPPILYAVDDSGAPGEIVDGQHRAGGRAPGASKTERALITKAAAYPPLIQERLRIIDTTTGLTVWAATRSLA